MDAAEVCRHKKDTEAMGEARCCLNPPVMLSVPASTGRVEGRAFLPPCVECSHREDPLPADPPA